MRQSVFVTSLQKLSPLKRSRNTKRAPRAMALFSPVFPEL